MALHEGDSWFYRARDGEQGSFLVIRKIEQIPGAGEVAHISVFRVHVKSPAAPGGFTDQIGHLPISTSRRNRPRKRRPPERRRRRLKSIGAQDMILGRMPRVAFSPNLLLSVFSLLKTLSIVASQRP